MPGRRVGRLTGRAAFAELRRARARGASGPVRVSFVPVPEPAHGVFPQVGYAIGRRCGDAVTRNTLRRRARSVVRDEAPALATGRFLVRVEAGAASLDREQFRSDVAAALRRASRAGVPKP